MAAIEFANSVDSVSVVCNLSFTLPFYIEAIDDDDVDEKKAQIIQ